MVIGIDCSRAWQKDKTGTENYSYHLVTQILLLPEAKAHVFVLFIRPKSVIPESVRRSNVVIQPIKFRYLWTQVGLAAATWTSKPRLDVLWVPAHTLPVFRRPKLKTVVTIHGLEYRWLPEYRNWLQRWYLPLSTIYATRAADRLIAVSKFTARQLEEQLRTPSKKIKVIQEGVEVKEVQNPDLTLRKYGVNEGSYVLFVGTIQPRKNLVSLIEAFAKYSQGFPEEKLVIAGAVGWMAADILAAPIKLGIPDRVVFTGRVSERELAGLYRGAGEYVQPSLTEGFGLPVLEAMGRGVPVVVSDGGALPETVGEAGLIVPLGPDFAGRLARTMGELKSDGGLRRRLAVAGSARAGRLSWQSAAKTTLQTLLKW